jgi:hypothetical protein
MADYSSDTPLYLALYVAKGNLDATRADRIIALFRGSKYSHAELIYDWSPVSKIGFSYGCSLRDGGIVRGNRLDFSGPHWEVYNLGTPVTVTETVRWFGQRFGQKFSWGKALGFSGWCSRRRTHSPFGCIAECLRLEDPESYTGEDLVRVFSATREHT